MTKTGGEKMESSLYSEIDKWMDKFNIKLEVTQQQLQEILERFSRRAITYELITSSILLVIGIILVIASIKLLKLLLKVEYFRKISYDPSVMKLKAYEVNKYTTYLFILCVMAGIGIPLVITQIHDIIVAIAFPEKTVLQFIGRYL